MTMNVKTNVAKLWIAWTLIDLVLPQTVALSQWRDQNLVRGFSLRSPAGLIGHQTLETATNLKWSDHALQQPASAVKDETSETANASGQPVVGHNRQLQASSQFECNSCLGVGARHACVAAPNGTMECWGQLDYSEEFTGPEKVITSQPENVTAVYVATKYYHSCAISNATELKCWGWNGYGQCNVPDEFRLGVWAVATGKQHTCAVLYTREIGCWGDNQRNQTSIPDDFTSEIQLVALGESHSCAVNKNQELQCWGDNSFKKCVPLEDFDVGIVSVACGAHHTCAVKSNGTVACWGTKFESTIPDYIQQAVNPDKAIEVVASKNSACVRDRGNRWWCWGTPDGIFNKQNVDVRSAVNASYDMVTIASSTLSPGCYVMANSELKCSDGSLYSNVPPRVQYLAANPVPVPSPSPAPINSGSSTIAVSVGIAVGVAITVLLGAAIAVLLYYRRRRATRASQRKADAPLRDTPAQEARRTPILMALQANKPKQSPSSPPLESLFEYESQLSVQTTSPLSSLSHQHQQQQQQNMSSASSASTAAEHQLQQQQQQPRWNGPPLDSNMLCMNTSLPDTCSMEINSASRSMEINSASLSSGGSSSGQSVRSVLINADELEVDTTEGGEMIELGRGGFSQVYRGHMNHVPVAIKVMRHTAQREKHIKSMLREASIMRRCCHTNIVTFYGRMVAQQDVVMVFELMQGDLFKALSSDAAQELRWHRRGKQIALDIARGLCHLHSQRIIHCDIKSPNVLLAEDGTAKIGDMGMSKFLVKEFVTKGGEIGSYAWAAPELLLNSHISEKVDIYSMGVIMWELVTGEHPARGQLRPIRVPEECPADIAELINACRKSAADSRPSAQQVVDVLAAHVE